MILVLGLVSAPLGLALRYLVGLLPVSPRPAAVVTGLAVGWALIPVLHPGMVGGVTFTSNPFAMIVIHGLAGGLGGVLWGAVEFGKSELAK